MRTIMTLLGGVTILLGSTAANAEGDPEAGKKVFNKCRACHVTDQEQNRVGPHLVGLFGREAGAVDSFKYSNAMKESGITWNDETVAAYVADPKGYIPDNKMAFAGVKDDADIQNLIAYLHEATGS
jgi:cytochrome c2